MKRLLIANRGEIAVRIARAARELEIEPLGIYSDADAGAYHREFMTESARVGAAAAADSYLNIANVLAAAKALRADAVHPGYGFLSERAEFALAVGEADLTFVGPSASAMQAMGSKIEAKRLMRKHGVPVVPGYDGDDQSHACLLREARALGAPLLIKASAGGGGRGMRVVTSLDAFDEALEAAKREALAAFGDDRMLLERYVSGPRHIEFQILADTFGTTLHLGERECSIQRRHQKIVEEAPSPALDASLRARMGEAAVRAAKAVAYANAGTVEFVMDASGAYYFLEMNTRLQVEHPVTELAYGVDLVHWQLRIARGERLTLRQAALQPRGSAIEVRLYAEDPANDLLPSTGTIARWEAPHGPGIRVDAGVRGGSEVSIYYDPMLAKLIVWGADRAAAVDRLTLALRDMKVEGVRTNIPLLLRIAEDDVFRSGSFTTAFLAERIELASFRAQAVPAAAVLLAIAGLLDSGAAWRIGGVGAPLVVESAGQRFGVEASRVDRTTWELTGDLSERLDVQRVGDELEVLTLGLRARGCVRRDGERIAVTLDGGSFDFALAASPSAKAGETQRISHDGKIAAPMPGRIVKVAVGTGDEVAERTLLVVLEAMKMEHRIEAPLAGTVSAIFVKEDDLVAAGTALVELR